MSTSTTALADAPHRDHPAPRTDVDWEELARSFVHPLRISILEVLGIDGGRELSPNELRLELQTPLARTNHHARALAAAGLIELVRTQDVRGAVEHFYRLAALARSTQSARPSSGPP